MARALSTFVASTAPSSTPVVFSTATRRSFKHAVVDHTAAYVAPGPRPPPTWGALTGIATLAPSADLLLATLVQSCEHLLMPGTRALATSLAHRYGADVGDAVCIGTETARNINAVFSDVRAVGQHALLVRVGRHVVSARMPALFSTNAPHAGARYRD